MNDSFRDPQQRAEACRALLATGGLERLWTSRGPTAEAQALARQAPSLLAAGHRALLLAALAFWTDEPVPLRFDELLGLAEAEPICKLTIAAFYGPQAVDVWLTRSDDIEGFAASPDEIHASAASLFDEARAVFDEGRDEAMNLRAAPDACALGASRMAEYVLIRGVSPVRGDKRRYKTAMQMTVHVLGLYAAIERERAAGQSDEDAPDADTD